MARLLYDIECDELLPDVTRMWTLVLHNLDTDERFEFLGILINADA